MNRRDTPKMKSSARDEEINQCCSNTPIYEIIYSLGKKWLVCFKCFELDYFNSDIKEKVRISI